MEDGEVNAFVKRRFPQRGSGAAGARKPTGAEAPPRREAPPRGVRDVRCSNCGTVGHAGRDCPAPRKDPRDRACFNCGKPGHQSRDCPEATQKAKALAEAPGAAPVQHAMSLSAAAPRRAGGQTFIGCLGMSEFEPVHRQRHKAVTSVAKARDAGRPQPQGCTVGECMDNAFARLRRAEALESGGQGATPLMSRPMAKLLTEQQPDPADVVDAEPYCGGCLSDDEDEPCLVPRNAKKRGLSVHEGCGCGDDHCRDSPGASPRDLCDPPGAPELREPRVDLSLQEFPELPQAPARRVWPRRARPDRAQQVDGAIKNTYVAELQNKIAIDVDDEFREMPDMEDSDDESDPVIAGPKLAVPETLQDLVNNAMDEALDLGLAVNDYLRDVGSKVVIDMDIKDEIENERNNLPSA